MKKICNKDFIIILMMIFLMIQPILDIKIFYDFEIIGVTIPTIIRLVFFAILFLIFIIDRKKLKFTIIYFFIFLIYTIFHCINASHNYINSLGNYSIISEIIYLIRLAIPMLFIVFSYNYKIDFKQINKLFYFLAIVFSLIMIITNILGIAYPAYPHANEIVGNILKWPFLSQTDISYFELATKGLFGYANPLSSLFCLILPILLYSFYKESSFKKFIIIILFLISMLMLGTRISSYLSVVILIIMVIVYIVFGCLFKTIKFNKKSFFYSIIMLVVTIPIFIVAPINFASDREMPDEHIKYVENNDLIDVVEKYKKDIKDNFSLEKEKEIKKFITDNSQYFSINEGIAPWTYLYDDYLEFWLDYFLVSYKNRNNTRDFELYLFNHIYEKNDNKFDILVGYGYSQTFNDGLVLEQDGIYHFYTLGIFGLLLFVFPYFFVLSYSIIKVLKDFNNKATLENITYIFIIGMLLCVAIIGGNLFDFFIVNIFLSFICGQLLYNVKVCKDVSFLKVHDLEKDKTTVSVIIPVYNVKDYIQKCLDSLVNQTLKQMEIIVIDDGSTDGTSEIIDNYKNKYPKLFKVVHKKNEGVSIARNVGLDMANGEYIGFLDSDDWVNIDMYEGLYAKAKSNDFCIVACDTLAIYPDSEVLIKSNISDLEEPKNLMLDAYAVIWNKIYKKSLIGEIRFKEKMNFCEDVRFLYMVYPKIKKIGSLDKALHNYLQRQGSLTYTYNEKLYQLIDSMDDIVDYYKKEKIYDTYKDELEYSYVRYLYATFIKRLAKTKNKEEFTKGLNYVIDKVNKTFPDYKKNKYIKRLGAKSLYLKFFNKNIAKVIYNLEKNRLN